MKRLLGLSVVVVLVLLSAAVAVAELPPGGTFIDDNGNFHEPNIEAIAAAGITQGCNPPTNNRYCPDDLVTRAQMAAFLLRGIGEDGNLPTYQGYFTDVSAGLWYTGYAERLYELGITTGCAVNPLRYCPNGSVTRAEMAAFILRAIGEDQNLPAYQAYFSDVPAGPWYTGYAERLFELGITTGCATGKYCPNDPVKRDQMASFLARALGLTPIVPPPSATTTTPPDGSFEAPYPVGVRAALSDFWDLRIESVDPNGYASILAECNAVMPLPCDEFDVVPPAAGSTYLMVRMSLTRTGPGSSLTPSLDLDSPTGATYFYFQRCNFGKYIPNPVFGFVEVFQGATVTGNMCWRVSIVDVGSLRLNEFEIWPPDQGPYFGPV